ncbi:MAG: replicative DNA helicase [bacterium P3]|nr:MAG: replicative DNA helicase [bacterium P3]KWW34436.1 MAG: replicative DNA helicase [bacterium F083]
MSANNNNSQYNNSQAANNAVMAPQPQAPEVEKAVLGALMIDNEAIGSLNDVIRPDTFYYPHHGTIMEAILQLNEKGHPIDVWTVTEQLSRMGKLDEVGGPAYIVELSSRVASSANIKYHAGIIATKSLSRQLIEYSNKINNQGFDATVDPSALLAEADDLLFEIYRKNTPAEYKSFNDNVLETLHIISAASESPDGITGIASYKSLDETTHGWQKGDLVIIAGRPAMGKTTFALSVASKIAFENQIPVGFFSLEMNRIDLTKKLISNLCEVDYSNFQSGRVLTEEWDRIYGNGDILSKAQLFIDDTPGMNLMHIRNQAKRMVRENDVQILFVDYLQLVHHDGKRFSSREAEVSHISRALKQLARDLDIPIIAISQLNRGVENRAGLEGKRPQLSDLRESGAIEQDADMVIFVHRPEYYHIYVDDKGRSLVGMAEIIIAKHRKGATADILMKFKGEYSRFEE